MIHALVEWLGGLYSQYGYLIVFLGSLGENTAFVGLILPGGTLALLGAFYARAGTLHIGWVIFFAWIGTVLGYHVDYLIGRFLLARYAPVWSASRLGKRLRLAGRLRLGRQDDLHLPRHWPHTLLRRLERRHDTYALPPLFGI